MNLTFKPEINPKSARMIMSKTTMGGIRPEKGDLVKRLYQEANEMRNRREQLEKIRDQEEIKECTFNP